MIRVKLLRIEEDGSNTNVSIKVDVPYSPDVLQDIINRALESHGIPVSYARDEMDD